MHKAFLMMLLTVVSGSAAAEWVKLHSDEAETVYADPVTIQKTGDVAKMHALFDYKTARTVGNNKSVLSISRQFEFDCKETRLRMVYFSLHSGNMAEGEKLFQDQASGKWSPIPPGSVGEGLGKFACAKR